MRCELSHTASAALKYIYAACRIWLPDCRWCVVVIAEPFSFSPSGVSLRVARLALCVCVGAPLYASHVSALRPAILTAHAHATFIAIGPQLHITHEFTRVASAARIPTASVAVYTLLRVCAAHICECWCIIECNTLENFYVWSVESFLMNKFFNFS